jgi:hypothetical protein
MTGRSRPAALHYRNFQRFTAFVQGARAVDGQEQPDTRQMNRSQSVAQNAGLTSEVSSPPKAGPLD